MSFSVPDDVRDRFDEVFEGRNKNAVITTLLLNAIEEEEQQRRSLGLVERLRLVADGASPAVGRGDRGAY